jgi:hypothetical protein
VVDVEESEIFPKEKQENIIKNTNDRINFKSSVGLMQTANMCMKCMK